MFNSSFKTDKLYNNPFKEFLISSFWEAELLIISVLACSKLPLIVLIDSLIELLLYVLLSIITDSVSLTVSEILFNKFVVFDICSDKSCFA